MLRSREERKGERTRGDSAKDHLPLVISRESPEGATAGDTKGRVADVDNLFFF